MVISFFDFYITCQYSYSLFSLRSQKKKLKDMILAFTIGHGRARAMSLGQACPRPCS